MIPLRPDGARPKPPLANAVPHPVPKARPLSPTCPRAARTVLAARLEKWDTWGYEQGPGGHRAGLSAVSRSGRIVFGRSSPAGGDCGSHGDDGEEHEEADEANPRIGNKHGHILELEERRGDAASMSFAWRLMLVCGDPDDPSTYFAGFDKNQVSPISCPDNVAFDPHGNLWIATDGNALGSNDGLFAVPVKGAERGHVKQFLTVPKAAETCGPIITEDRILVAAQHPGETTGATAENPGSRWPDGAGSIPRPSVVAVWKDKHR